MCKDLKIMIKQQPVIILRQLEPKLMLYYLIKMKGVFIIKIFLIINLFLIQIIMQKHQIVDIKTLINANKEINITILKKVLDQGKIIPLNFVQTLIHQFISITREEPNILRKIQPLTIVGDIHGQYPDLLKVLSLCPNLEDHPEHTILFLGDYVDRGPFGMEVIILLMALKVKHKKSVIMLRGNHQSRQMTQCFNFYQQACNKYSQDIYFEIMDAFDALPLSCIVNEKYFCVHGGISPKAIQVQKINKQQRSREIPLEGVVCDLMWADPTQDDQGKTSQMFDPNINRNCSIIFGKQLGQAFLKKNNFVTIIRAHQVQMEGFKQHRWPGWNQIPTVYTIFSAPNYCGTHQNKGAILTIKDNNFSIRQYKQQDPKYFVPEKYNAFNFSLPRLGQFIDKFCKKMGKVKTKKVPELQKLTDAQVIGFLLGYIRSQNIPEKSFFGKGFNQKIVNSKEQNSNLQKSIFQKSQHYFYDTEKRRNDSVIIMNEKGQKTKMK